MSPEHSTKYPRLFNIVRWYGQMTFGEINDCVRRRKQGIPVPVLLDAYQKRRVYRKIFGSYRPHQR